MFNAAGSSITVPVEAGSGSALLYVLLHEGTHAVDFELGLSRSQDEAASVHTAFSEGVWQDRLTHAAAYRGDLIERTIWRKGGEPIPIAQAPALYRELEKTPFASVYGSNNCSEDIAEMLAWYDLTERRGWTYRVVVRDGDKELYSYEPMKSPLVRSRFPLLQLFFAPS